MKALEALLLAANFLRAGRDDGPISKRSIGSRGTKKALTSANAELDDQERHMSHIADQQRTQRIAHRMYEYRAPDQKKPSNP